MAYIKIEDVMEVLNKRNMTKNIAINEIKNLPTADVVELSEVKKVIMDYIFDQTVSKYPTAELYRASIMGAEGVIYALENAFGAKMDGGNAE